MHQRNDFKESRDNRIIIPPHDVVLFPADCNYTLKHIGREMMKHAENQHSIAPEQFGSCKAHKAIDQALNKVLTNKLLRKPKLSGAICSNDAKSCYDLIVHTPASLSMQLQGVPRSAVVCLFNMLQNISHQIRMAYGDSEHSYGGSHWILPKHGVGQGNGAGPAVWAVVSTPLLAMLRNSGVGTFFKSPISGKEIRFVGYAFVDDTHLIQTAHDNITTGIEVTNELQRALLFCKKIIGILWTSDGLVASGHTFLKLTAPLLFGLKIFMGITSL